MGDEQATSMEHALQAKASDEHRWLQRLVGDWDYEHSYTDEQGTTHSARGAETARAVGDLWVLLEGRGEMPGGGEATMLMTLGFDPGRGHFVGSWIGSMMTHLWVYEGQLEGDTLSLHSAGPDMTTPGKMARYKDVIQLLSADERTLTGHLQGPDGSWVPLMTARYTRRR